MGRQHIDVVVVIAYDAKGNIVREDIVPRQNFAVSGSLLLNSSDFRQLNGIRMISVRIFDDKGVKLDAQMRYYSLDGIPVEAFHRRPDGTIIEDRF
jgi:hypothetical protein